MDPIFIIQSTQKNSKYFKFLSVNSIKLLSINVRKVTNVIVNVIKKIITINRFLFKKVNIS